MAAAALSKRCYRTLCCVEYITYNVQASRGEASPSHLNAAMYSHYQRTTCLFHHLPPASARRIAQLATQLIATCYIHVNYVTLQFSNFFAKQ